MLISQGHYVDGGVAEIRDFSPSLLDRHVEEAHVKLGVVGEDYSILESRHDKGQSFLDGEGILPLRFTVSIDLEGFKFGSADVLWLDPEESPHGPNAVTS